MPDHHLRTVHEEKHVGRATELHEKAHSMCFIARSVNFPITVHPVVTVAIEP